MVAEFVIKYTHVLVYIVFIMWAFVKIMGFVKYGVKKNILRNFIVSFFIVDRALLKNRFSPKEKNFYYFTNKMNKLFYFALGIIFINYIFFLLI